MDLLICSACGVQHSAAAGLSSCKICDDPRQYIPAAGLLLTPTTDRFNCTAHSQQWTTLGQLQASQKYHNEFVPEKDFPGLISIYTVPQFAIGQRALLCLDGNDDDIGSSNSGEIKKKQKNNVLWDCITYIDDETIERIQALGGLSAIVISHPHFFSTSVQWADAFECPVYISCEDEQWLMRRGPRHVLWEGTELALPAPAATADFLAIKAGGHFPGSAVLWWKSARKLLVADTIMVVPSGIYHVDRVPGTTSFTFMWSYPNMIPLPPDEVLNIWKAIKHADFDDVHGGFVGRDTKGNSRQRVLESAKIIVRAMGYLDHAIHQET